MQSRSDSRGPALTRRLLLAGTAIAMLVPSGAGRAEVKSLELIAPAGPGGGYDQLARATQEVLLAKRLASGVQVQNIPGAGGTIGLAQFVTKGSRSPSLLVAGLGLIGAVAINKSPVTLDQVAPITPANRRVPAARRGRGLADQVGG